MRRPNLKETKQACLAVHSLIVRHNNAGCAAGPDRWRIACKGSLQCAHLLPKKGRGNWAVALEPINAVVLCGAHHRFLDSPANVGRWLGLIVDTIGVDHLLDLQREGDRRAEAHGTGSRLAWYRAQLMELVGHAQTVGADWAQAVPNWVARWINTETPHVEMRRRRAQGATLNQIAAEHATTAAQAHRIIANTSPLPDDDDNPECRECARAGGCAVTAAGDTANAQNAD